jgi:hypothetical protein
VHEVHLVSCQKHVTDAEHHDQGTGREENAEGFDLSSMYDVKSTCLCSRMYVCMSDIYIYIYIYIYI